MKRLLSFLSLLALSAPGLLYAEVPVRTAAITGMAVPGGETEIEEVSNSRIGPGGEVTFLIRSGRNQVFPGQPLLDLRGVSGLSPSEQKLIPIFGDGVVRDAEIDGFVANASDVFAPEFQHDGELVIRAKAVPPGDTANTDAWIVRSPDGSLQVAAHSGTATTPVPYRGISSVQVDADGQIVVAGGQGHWFGGDDPQQIYDANDPAPWDAEEMLGVFTSTPLDDGSIAFCCFEGAPIHYTGGALNLTDPTPPTMEPVPQLATIGVHHTGAAMYTDTARDMMNNPFNAVFLGAIGERATFATPTYNEGICASPLSLSSSNVVPTLRGMVFTSPCVGLVDSTQRWFGPGDSIADDQGTLESILFPDVLVSDGGEAVGFLGTAARDGGSYSGLFLIERPGTATMIELVAEVGGAAPNIGGATIGSLFPTAINDAGQMTFEADVTTDEGSRRAVFVTNQSPTDREADLRISAEIVDLDIEVTVENFGPNDVNDLTVTVDDVPPGLRLDQTFCELNGTTARCEFGSVDPIEPLVPAQGAYELTIDFVPDDDFESPSGSASAVTVESSTTDPAPDNDTVEVFWPFDAIVDVEVEVKRVDDLRAELFVTVSNGGEEALPLFLTLRLLSDETLTIESVSSRTDGCMALTGNGTTWVARCPVELEGGDDVRFAFDVYGTGFIYEAVVVRDDRDDRPVLATDDGIIDIIDTPRDEDADGCTVAAAGRGPGTLFSLLVGFLLVLSRRRRAAKASQSAERHAT